MNGAGQASPGTNPMQQMQSDQVPPQAPPGTPPPAQAGMQVQPQPQTPPENPDSALNKMLEQVNIAKHLSEEVLNKMGSDVYDGYRVDWDSKRAWDRQVDDWVKLAGQIKEPKMYPWPGAANVKYPLLATAAMQFAARAYPALIPSDGNVVQFRVVGLDPQGLKANKADKLAKFMNFQLMQCMEDWEEEMDRLLIQLPVVGCLFKKTYFDPIKKKNESRLIGPKDLIVNYWATSLEDAYRKTEVILMTKNQVKELQNAKTFLDIDLPDPSTQPDVPSKSDVHGNTPPGRQDATTPYVFLEQHTFWDIDKDGYAEPYVITIEESSKKVFRVVARYDSDGINQDKKGDIISVKPVEYYTKYGFIPNPDGGFYDIGFGHLLGPMNDSANTIVNQLIDSGSLANLQSGFIGKGLKIKMGESKFGPGEWKAVNASGQDIKAQIFPLPTKEPSAVLLQLLNMLLQSGRELASVAEIFTGKMPGQNTPATTTNNAIDQGMKVFTAIYKRTYRSMTKEFRKIFRLNGLYDENFEEAQKILDEPIQKEDFDEDNYDVYPTADPAAVSTTQKMQKVQELMQLIPLGTVNIMEVTKRFLDAQEQPNPGALMQQPQQKQDPKMAAAQMKGQMDQQKAQLDIQAKNVQAELKSKEMQQELQYKSKEQQMDMTMKQMELRMKAMELQLDMKSKAMAHTMDMTQQAQAHQQATEMQDQKHEQGIKQMKEKANVQRDTRKVSGMAGKSSDSGSKGSNKK